MSDVRLFGAGSETPPDTVMPAKAREKKTRPAVEESDAAAMIKIALADDHTIFRDGLRRLLALEDDFDIVAEAKDGTEVMPIL